MNSRLLDADITYVVYSALRVVASSGRRRSQLKVAHHHLVSIDINVIAHATYLSIEPDWPEFKQRGEAVRGT
jgi:hypothetical protein